MFSQLAKRSPFVVVSGLEARSGTLDGLSLSQSENKGLGEVLSLAGQ